MKNYRLVLLTALSVSFGFGITLHFLMKNDIIMEGAKTTIQNIIEERQQEVNSLTEKKEQLTVLLDADKKIIDALFEEQERRSKYNSSISIFIGFLMGIIGSVIATFLYNIIRKRLKTNN